MMTKQEFAILAKAIRAVYPNMLADDGAKNVWYELLKDLDYRPASAALQRHLQTSKFPPTIADIRTAVTKPKEEMPELEAWALARKAIRCDPDSAKEQFERLPELVQKTIGTPAALTEWGQLPSETVGSVIQSQFLRGYRAQAERQRTDAAIAPKVRQLIEETGHLMLGAAT